MTTTTTTTCPAWCTAPHEANIQQLRQMDLTEDVLAADIALELRSHSARVGVGPLSAIVEPESTGGQIDCNGEDVADAEEARALAAILLAAADKLDEIETSRNEDEA